MKRDKKELWIRFNRVKKYARKIMDKGVTLDELDEFLSATLEWKAVENSPEAREVLTKAITGGKK